MLIAFEGPDNVGKSTAAKQLTSFDANFYQVTNITYRDAQRALGDDHDLVQTFDRISWLSHMVYRLALPDREWHDAAVRTVFAMPDTHLVFGVHNPNTADFHETEPDSRTGLVIDTPIAKVNPVYWWIADALTRLNQFQDYTLFKSISIMEVTRTGLTFTQELKAHDNPSWSHDHDPLLPRMVTSNEDLLEFLREQDRQLG